MYRGLAPVLRRDNERDESAEAGWIPAAMEWVR